MSVHRTWHAEIPSEPDRARPCEEAANHGTKILLCRLVRACVQRGDDDGTREGAITIMASLCFEVEHVYVGSEANGFRWSKPCDQLARRLSHSP